MSMERKENCETVCTTSHGTILGLVGQYLFENGSSQFVFMDVKSESGASLDHSLSFSTENFVQTLALCNGLLLLSGFRGDQPCYHVFNPLTKNNFMIPQTSIQGGVVRAGLAFDGCQNQFEVVLVEACSSKANILELHVFSSDTGKWSSHNPTNINVPTLPEFAFQELGTPPLYSNGALHWEMGGYLLVYNVQGSHCELYELPNCFDDWSWQSTLTYRRCLCESGGNIYYCYTDFDGFHIWNLLNENQPVGPFYSCDHKKFPWRLVDSVMHEVFMSNLIKQSNFCGSIYGWEPYKVAPIAYSEETQTIYLQLPGNVLSYRFDTGCIGSVCNYSYPGMNFNCCSFFSSTSNGPHNAQRDANGETELNLPIAEMAKLAL